MGIQSEELAFRWLDSRSVDRGFVRRLSVESDETVADSLLVKAA